MGKNSFYIIAGAALLGAAMCGSYAISTHIEHAEIAVVSKDRLIQLSSNGDGGSILGSIEQYGVAVRAGAITPQADDEAAFRKALGLPTMSKEVTDAWTKVGVKAPITLAKPEDLPDAPPSAGAAASSTPPFADEFDEDDKVNA